MTDRPGTVQRVTRLIESIAQKASGFPPDRWRTPLLLIAALLFVGGAVTTATRVDLAWSELRWPWLVAATVFGTPAAITVNAMEFQLSGRAIGARIAFPRALGVSITATAANQLPVPGGALVRVQALRQAGHRYRHAVGSTMAIAFAWVAVALLLAGAVVTASGHPSSGALLAAAGIPPAIFMLLIAWRAFPAGGRPRLIVKVLGVEVLSVLADALRLHMVLLGMNQDVGFATPLLIALAGVIAAVAGIFPSGLGMREALAAALVPLAGVSASIGFLAAAVSRVLGLTLLAPVTVAVALRARRESPEPTDSDHDAGLNLASGEPRSEPA